MSEAIPSKLNEDPVDTRVVVEAESGAFAPAPQHLGRRLFIYISIGFVVCCIILSILGWFYIRAFKSNVKSTDLQTNIKVQPPVQAASTSGDFTAKDIKWINYTNRYQHYTISYPITWDLGEDTEDTVILYPPDSREYENLTQDDIGAGIGPKILISLITRPFMTPDSKYSEFSTDSGLKGYLFTQAGGPSGIPSIDFPFNNAKEILEFSLHNIGEDNIARMLKVHNSIMAVHDIDEATFEKIAKSLDVAK